MSGCVKRDLMNFIWPIALELTFFNMGTTGEALVDDDTEVCDLIGLGNKVIGERDGRKSDTLLMI